MWQYIMSKIQLICKCFKLITCSESWSLDRRWFSVYSTESREQLTVRLNTALAWALYDNLGSVVAGSWRRRAAAAVRWWRRYDAGALLCSNDR